MGAVTEDRQALARAETLLDLRGDAEGGVLVLAASNHPWDVAPALRRPGRLDRPVERMS